MRMWNLPPRCMCDQHLLGEHVEMHMFVGAINKGISIHGYLEKGLVETHNIRKRHSELVAEMIGRGFNHKSELPEFRYTDAGYIDRKKNWDDLTGRCKDCLALFHKWGEGW